VSAKRQRHEAAVKLVGRPAFISKSFSNLKIGEITYHRAAAAPAHQPSIRKNTIANRGISASNATMAYVE
jgi:hypothetical protein